jgi:site-specific DNA-methyltransferase (adenine-specific)
VSIEYGDIKIHFQDCMEGMKAIRTASVQLVLTDPPYGIGFSGKHRFYQRKDENVIEGYVEVPYEEYEEFSEKWLTQAFRILKQNGTCYAFCPYDHIHRVIRAAEKVGFIYLSQLIYIRPFPLWRNRGWVLSHYNIIMLVKSEDYVWNMIEDYQRNIFFADRNFETEGESAPTRLDPKVVYKLIKTSSNKGDLIVEPFAGSGTVPYCAYNLDRKCIAFELNENMRAIIESNFSFDLTKLMNDNECPECGAPLISTRESYGKVIFRCSECKWRENNE